MDRCINCGAIIGKNIHVCKPAWNKGLTKETDERILKYAKKLCFSLKGKKAWNKGTGKIKKCQYCNKNFKFRLGAKEKYCSMECLKRYFQKKLEKVCPICKKLFRGDRKTSKYCSVDCKRKGWFKRLKLKCFICNQEFFKKRDKIKKFNFCSVRCRDLWRKVSNFSRGKNNPHYGKPRYHDKAITYKTVMMKSSWEVKVAKFLDDKKIDWVYEPKRFYFLDWSFLPDFYLPKYNRFIEVKGYYDRRSKSLLTLFKKHNQPEYSRLIIIDEFKINILDEVLDVHKLS